MKTRLTSIVAVARAFALLGLMILGLSALWLCPWIWLVAGGRLAIAKDPLFKFLIFANLLLYWMWSNALVIKDIQALRSKPRVLPSPLWYVEIPASRQPWASELVEFVESKFSEHLRGRLQVCLSLVPGVEYQTVPGSPGKKWRIAVGFSTLAVLSTDEIKALALQHGISRFRPITRAHRWLTDLLERAEWWKSALLPHPGFFSFTRCSVEWLVDILKPFPSELARLSLNAAGGEFPVAVIRRAAEKVMKAGRLQGTYAKLYDEINKRGMMPPYTEGIFRLCRSIDLEVSQPAFRRIDGLWAYERQFLGNCFGPSYARHIQLVNWDDLKEEIAFNWREKAAEMRPLLGGSRVADIPQLVSGWRATLKAWLLFRRVAPNITPDLQRQFVISMLAAVFAVVLLDAGWRVGSTFGEEVSLVNDKSRVQPFRLLKELGTGALSAAQFNEDCRKIGAADLLLGPTEDSSSVPET
ncbi:MAG: hypothetical protein JO210_16805 [Acidobacteriaceae bacterium]|nr:hypothetical protein [Acidobacteriaceae bacterium]